MTAVVSPSRDEECTQYCKMGMSKKQALEWLATESTQIQTMNGQIWLQYQAHAWEATLQDALSRDPIPEHEWTILQEVEMFENSLTKTKHQSNNWSCIAEHKSETRCANRCKSTVR